jgi:zinc/manganese transport system permease protein
MNADWQILGPAALAAIIMSPMHTAFGLHIIRRGVIFIDLAVAQVAALGMALALANGMEPHSGGVYWVTVASALIGALLISVTRFKLGRVPHEAMIGIIFVMGSAAIIVVQQYTSHGPELLKDLLDGQIMFVQESELKRDAFIYGGMAILTAVLWKWFCRRTESPEETGVRATVLDFLFYAMIGVIVASSVQVAGILVVFTWLVMPAVIATTWTKTITKALVLAVPIAWAGSLLGTYVSLKADPNLGGWPTGASIVVVFGAMVMLNYVVRLFIKEPAA